MIPVRRALFSTYSKEGLVPLAQEVARWGAEIIASGGTARTLVEAGLEVTVSVGRQKIFTREHLAGRPEAAPGLDTGEAAPLFGRGHGSHAATRGAAGARW